VVTGLAKEILTEFTMAEEVKISIKKLQVPVIGLQGHVGIGFELKRSELSL
jgi:dihydroneopterin aldolase